MRRSHPVLLEPMMAVEVETPADYVGNVIGDLSSVWLTVFVREMEAPKVIVGQDISFTVPALPGRSFSGTIEYVAAAIDPRQ